MATTQLLHASAFVYCGAGCLLLGDSGVGKSSVLAAAIIHGATMIADDQVVMHAKDGLLIAQAPKTLEGILELRGMGLIRHPFIATHPMHLVVTLGVTSNERLPEHATWDCCKITLPHLSLKGTSELWIPSLLLYLQAVQEKRTLATDWCPKG